MLTAWDDTGFRCSVHFPGLCRERWPFDEITDPFLLFNAIGVFHDKLGMSPTFPQRAARDLFVSTLKQRPLLVTDDPDNYWAPFIEKMESDIIRVFDLNDREKGLDWVHAFDKRMMFLSAARAVMVGSGPYEYIENVPYTGQGKAVGLVEIEKPIFENVFKPEFARFLADFFGDSTLFMSAYLPIIEQFTTRPIKIKRGWIWRKPERLFEKFAVRLGDAIRETRSTDPEQKAANGAFKTMYTIFFGWLGRLENRTGYNTELFRPDWRASIVSLAGANLLRNVLDVYQYTKVLPFAVNHDCLMYFSDSEKWRMEFDKTAVSDPNKFTHEWTAPGEKVRAAILAGKNAMQIESEVRENES